MVLKQRHQQKHKQLRLKVLQLLFLTGEPLIEITSGAFLKEWFKIVED